MDLFHFREESPGSVFGMKKDGCYFKDWSNTCEWNRLAGYKEINTPELLDKTLWENLDIGKSLEITSLPETPDEKTFAVKPMNCPGCVQVFNQD